LNPFAPLLWIAASAAVTFAAVVPFRRLALARGLVARPRADRFHDRIVPLLGGPACVLGLAAAGILCWRFALGTGTLAQADGRLLLAALVGILGMSVLGLRDDKSSLSPFPKAAIEGLVLLAVLWIWKPSGRLAGVIPGAIAWASAMLLVNAWNYLDHADGVFSAAILASSGFVAMASRTAAVGPIVAGLLWGLCGAGLGFLGHNRPPARIFLGDAGSLPLGLASILAGLAIVDGAPAALVGLGIAGQALPLSDLLLVSCTRLRARRSPFVGGREHTGHRLTRLLGPWGAVLTVAVIAAALGGLGLLTGALRPPAAIGGVLLGSAVLALLVGRLPSPDAP
jgi:UDP-GlcNAc:undecaprenyl-phosphate GlcNAc-1-phosphate transferase